MIRTVHAHRLITGRSDRFADALIADTRELLQRATGEPVTPPDGDGSFLISLSNHGLGTHMRKRVRVRLGEVVRHANWIRIPISWEADPVRVVFPSFEGGIEMEAHDLVRAEVAVYGEYRPPLGPVGAIGDTLLVHGAARQAVTRLVNNIARALVDRVYGDGQQGEEVQRTHMTVGDIMSSHMLAVEEDLSLRAAANRMLLLGISGVPVLDDRERVVGVLSERDLLDKVAEEPTGVGRAEAKAWRHYIATTVGEACTRPARMTSVDTSVREAAREMARHDVDRLIVMDDASVVGIVTRSDALKALVRPDVDIADAVAAEIGSLGEAEVRVEVSDGQVDLRGELSARSRLHQVVSLAEEVDGVILVDADRLTWRIDDVTAIPPLV